MLLKPRGVESSENATIVNRYCDVNFVFGDGMLLSMTTSRNFPKPKKLLSIGFE